MKKGVILILFVLAFGLYPVAEEVAYFGGPGPHSKVAYLNTTT